MNVPEPYRNIETIRENCFDRAAAAFASNHIDLELYESLAQEIASAADAEVLTGIAARLPQLPAETGTDVQVIDAQAANVRKEGRWITSNSIRLLARRSNVRLDFRSHLLQESARVHLVLDCEASNVNLIVPQDVDVVEQLDENHRSVFRARNAASSGRPALTITGSISASNVHVRRRRVRVRRR